MYPIRVKKGEAIPEGAIYVKPDKVVEIQKKRISEWKPWHEAWSFRVGPTVLGCMTAISGTFVTSHYRNVLKLYNTGLVSTAVAGIIIPSVVSMMAFTAGVSIPILKTSTSCSICMETRGGAIQMLLGGIYPFIISPIACLIQAKNFNTYAVPLLENKKEFGTLIKKTLPKRYIGTLFLLQFSVGMFITEEQLRFFENKLMSPEALQRIEKPSEDITYR